jgi:hypothetical protein
LYFAPPKESAFSHRGGQIVHRGNFDYLSEAAQFSPQRQFSAAQN